MKLRCKHGDIAVVVGEAPGYESNIGRLVHVRGPLEVNPRYGPSWLIFPVRQELWAVEELTGERHDVLITWGDRVEHADCWLLPVHGDRLRARDRALLKDRRVEPSAKVVARRLASATAEAHDAAIQINGLAQCQKPIPFHHPAGTCRKDSPSDFLTPHDIPPALVGNGEQR